MPTDIRPDDIGQLQSHNHADTYSISPESDLRESLQILQAIATTDERSLTLENARVFGGYTREAIDGALERVVDHIFQTPGFENSVFIKKVNGDESLILARDNDTRPNVSSRSISLKYFQHGNVVYTYSHLLKGESVYSGGVEDWQTDTFASSRHIASLDDLQVLGKGLRFACANLITWSKPGIIQPDKLSISMPQLTSLV